METFCGAAPAWIDLLNGALVIEQCSIRQSRELHFDFLTKS
jgi:hypothetical protein